MPAKSEHDRRYDYAHKQARKRWDVIVQQGGVNCHRCGTPIAPGTRWHLDHHDDGTGSSPSHSRCNTATSKIWRDKALGRDTNEYCPCGQPYAWFDCDNPRNLPHRPA